MSNDRTHDKVVIVLGANVIKGFRLDISSSNVTDLDLLSQISF